MVNETEEDWGFSTQAIRTGHHRTPEGEHSEPIFPTSSFVFASAAEAAARFGGTEPGNIYSRFTNPTVRCFEQRLAALEGVITSYSIHYTKLYDFMGPGMRNDDWLYRGDGR